MRYLEATQAGEKLRDETAYVQSPLLFKRNKSSSYCQSHESGHIVYTQAAHQVSSMRLDGFDAYTQDVSDLLGVFSLGNQPQDLTLARS